MAEEFDYRRVIVEGRWRHDQEMLIGPRMRDGQEGYVVVTPLERESGQKILVNRGWISKDMGEQRKRDGKEALPSGTVMVEGLLRRHPKGNAFTPNNDAERNRWYFTDVKEMARYSGSQPVYIEETFGMLRVLFSFFVDVEDVFG